MTIESGSGKQIVCITGSVWTGNHKAPRRKLVKAGFVRPLWFTTTYGITDGYYRRITPGEFSLAKAQNDVYAYIEHGSGHLGIFKRNLEQALVESERGALIVAPPEMAAKIALQSPNAVIFTLKCATMELSRHLKASSAKHQIHRINVESEQVGAWDKAYVEIGQILGL